MALGSFGKPGSAIYRPLADINVTPLVDVMLVLLIIFMVTAPLFSAGLKVNLPQAKTVVPLDPKEPIVLSIQKDGKLALGSDDVSADDLISAIEAKAGGDRNRVIHLRSDKDVPFGDVVSIMDRLATNGLTHLAIVARPGNANGQNGSEAVQGGSAGASDGPPAVPAPASDSPPPK